MKSKISSGSDLNFVSYEGGFKQLSVQEYTKKQTEIELYEQFILVTKEYDLMHELTISVPVKIVNIEAMLESLGGNKNYMDSVTNLWLSHKKDVFESYPLAVFKAKFKYTDGDEFVTDVIVWYEKQ